MSWRALIWGILAVVVLAACDTAAAGSADCPALCQQAQDKGCTALQGDCNADCASLDKVASAGTCAGAEDAYFACLGEGDTCTGDSRCGNQRQSLMTCVTQYCTVHPSDGDCQAVGAALE